MSQYSPLLINESPLQVLPTLAVAVGLNEALILQQTQYRLQYSQVEFDGRKWIDRTAEQWKKKEFPFWGLNTIRRAIANLESRGLLISRKLNQSGYDQTKWYTIDYEPLNRMVTELPKMGNSSYPNRVDQVTQNGQFNLPKVDNSLMKREISKKINAAADDARARTREEISDQSPSGQQDGQSSASHSPADPPFDTTDPDDDFLDRLTGKKAPVNPYTAEELALSSAVQASGLFDTRYLLRTETRLQLMQLAGAWVREGLEETELEGLLKDLKDEGRQPTHVNYIARPVADYLQAKKNPVGTPHAGPGSNLNLNNTKRGPEYGSHSKIHQGPNGYRNRTDRIFDQLKCIPPEGFCPHPDDPFIPDDTEF